MGRPNWTRSLAWARALSRAPRAAPTDPAATETRPLSRADIAMEKPRPSSPRTASAGTRTSSRNSCAVGWPRRPSLPWIVVRSSPGESVGTRNAVMPLGPGPPVRAKMRATSAQVPLVMNILEPLSR